MTDKRLTSEDIEKLNKALRDGKVRMLSEEVRNALKTVLKDIKDICNLDKKISGEEPVLKIKPKGGDRNDIR